MIDLSIHLTTVFLATTLPWTRRHLVPQIVWFQLSRHAGLPSLWIHLSHVFLSVNLHSRRQSRSAPHPSIVLGPSTLQQTIWQVSHVVVLTHELFKCPIKCIFVLHGRCVPMLGGRGYYEIIRHNWYVFLLKMCYTKPSHVLMPKSFKPSLPFYCIVFETCQEGMPFYHGASFLTSCSRTHHAHTSSLHALNPQSMQLLYVSPGNQSTLRHF